MNRGDDWGKDPRPARGLAGATGLLVRALPLGIGAWRAGRRRLEMIFSPAAAAGSWSLMRQPQLSR